MEAPHHRKVDLKSTGDLAYLYTNTLNLSHEKLDLHFPPSANNDSDDPMKARVRELVDDFITKTFTTAIPSISVNGIDSTGSANLQLSDFLSTREQVEYEPFDSKLAARVTSLYAQLESLTTTVAQMRRDAPVKAARNYAEMLKSVMEEDEKEFGDGEMVDIETLIRKDEGEEESSKNKSGLDWARIRESRPEWILDIPFGTERERDRWRDGEIGDVYADGLRTLVRLQGEATLGKEESDDEESEGGRSKGLAATVGKVERARQAAEVVEKM